MDTNSIQLVLHILSYLRTTHLGPLSSVSYGFHSLVLRLLHQRLSSAADLGKHILLLECYPPSGRLFEPALPCSYLGTDGLDDYKETLQDTARSPTQELRSLRELCSRFRPRRSETGRKAWTRHPAGDVPGSRTYVAPEAAEPGSSRNPGVPKAEPEELPVTHLMHLDSTEMFTQLCARTFAAIPGTKPNIYRDYIDVNDGVVRVFRNWLAEEAKGSTRSTEKPHAGIVWANDGEQVGIRLKVKKRAWHRTAVVPLLQAASEDMPVSYEIQYEGKCLRCSDAWNLR